ncbi:dnaJ homolog subfamily C member 17 [Tripterygium wilfordii]|uniref:dnaJ homolog subfamily C member 17 n=1 Tax=Tripterygium wilfordii TaxID=458696 RepID=UPI0018F8549D|nr:dnaJ homolog subfamily C member 17 [Tripterygium wilfordii]
MDNVDHYAVLGLPSGEEGAKLTEKEISKAYKFKALELHPDKRPDDPNAHDNFQKLKSSYEILKDEKARKLFDDLLRIKRDQHQRHTQRDAKRRRMVSDLEEREHAAAFDPDPELKAKQEEERIARKLKEEIERIRAMHKGKGQGAATATAPESSSTGNVGGTGVVLDKSKVLKVSWEKVGEEYTADRLRELFSKFGKVEDVVIKSSKKKGSALVVMSTKEAAFSATGNVCGHLSNPLLVLPLQPVIGTEFPNAQKNVESDRLNNLVGAGFMAYEEKILEKLQKAAKNKS